MRNAQGTPNVWHPAMVLHWPHEQVLVNRKRERIQRFAATVLLAWSMLGCERKAPGPKECHELAVAWEREAEPTTFHPSDPRAQLTAARVEERTRLCLVTPFDRKAVECVRSGRSARLCLRSLERRLGERESSTW